MVSGIEEYSAAAAAVTLSGGGRVGNGSKGRGHIAGMKCIVSTLKSSFVHIKGISQ